MARIEHDPRFGRGLKILIEREELTNVLVADFAELSVDTVSRIRRGAMTPSKKTAQKIAAVFRMTAEQVEALGAAEETE